MYLLTVNSETSAAALAARAAGVSASANAATVQQLTSALVAANPNVDFTNLKPGTLLVVPSIAGVDLTAVDNSVNPVVDNVVQYLTQGLSAVAGRLQNNTSAVASNRAELTTYLGTAVTTATPSQPSLVTLTNQLQTGLTAQTTQDASWGSRFQQAQTQMNTDLTQLAGSIK